MFNDLIEYPIVSKRLKWKARYVVRDYYKKPHVFLRLELTGTRFPHMAENPFTVVGETRSVFTLIADDGSAAYAYFDQPLTPRGKIEFGYGVDVVLRFPGAFSVKGLKLLDRKLLPAKTVNVDRFFGGTG